MVKLDDLVFYHFLSIDVLLHKNQNASFDLHSFLFEKVMTSPNYLHVYIQLNHNKISIHIYWNTSRIFIYIIQASFIPANKPCMKLL